MSRKVKHKKSTQITGDDESINLSGWLGYEIELSGTIPCRVGSKRLEEHGDLICEPSDGIPYAEGTELKVVFDNGSDSAKRISIEYTVIECC